MVLPKTLSGIMRWLGKDMALMYAGAGALGMLKGVLFPVMTSRQIGDLPDYWDPVPRRSRTHARQIMNASLHRDSYRQTSTGICGERLREPLSEMDGRRPSLSSGSGDWVSGLGSPFSRSHPCGDSGPLSARTLLRACAFSLLGLPTRGKG